MKILKAIEILSDAIKRQWPTHNSDLDDAIKLGIEALEKIQKYRHTSMQVQSLILRGETPED